MHAFRSNHLFFIAAVKTPKQGSRTKSVMIPVKGHHRLREEATNLVSYMNFHGPKIALVGYKMQILYFRTWSQGCMHIFFVDRQKGIP